MEPWLCESAAIPKLGAQWEVGFIKFPIPVHPLQWAVCNAVDNGPAAFLQNLLEVFAVLSNVLPLLHLSPQLRKAHKSSSALQ